MLLLPRRCSCAAATMPLLACRCCATAAMECAAKEVGTVVEHLELSANVRAIELLMEGGPQLAMRWCADQVKLGSAAAIFVVDIEEDGLPVCGM